MQISLSRYNAPDWVLGRLHAGPLSLWTIERPWLDNKRNESCIPDGEYELSHFRHAAWGDAWLLHDVPNRSEILIHPANYAHELRGCIAPGIDTSYGYTKNKGFTAMVTDSRRAMRALYDVLGEDFHTIKIDSVVAR